MTHVSENIMLEKENEELKYKIEELKYQIKYLKDTLVSQDSFDNVCEKVERIERENEDIIKHNTDLIKENNELKKENEKLLESLKQREERFKHILDLYKKKDANKDCISEFIFYIQEIGIQTCCLYNFQKYIFNERLIHQLSHNKISGEFCEECTKKIYCYLHPNNKIYD